MTVLEEIYESIGTGGNHINTVTATFINGVSAEYPISVNTLKLLATDDGIVDIIDNQIGTVLYINAHNTKYIDSDLIKFIQTGIYIY